MTSAHFTKAPYNYYYSNVQSDHMPTSSEKGQPVMVNRSPTGTNGSIFFYTQRNNYCNTILITLGGFNYNSSIFCSQVHLYVGHNQFSK